MGYKHYDEETNHIYDAKTNLPVWVWVFVKFTIYGGLGMILEIVFTDLVRIVQDIFPSSNPSFTSMIFPNSIPDQMKFDPRYLFSMSSVWMVLVYGSGLLGIESVYRFLNPAQHKRNLLFKKSLHATLIRALVYSVVIMVTEFVWGWVLHFVLIGSFQLWNTVIPAGTPPQDNDFFLWQYRGSSLVTTTPQILLYWFFAGIAAEVVVKKLNENDMRRAFLTDHDDLREQKQQRIQNPQGDV